MIPDQKITEKIHRKVPEAAPRCSGGTISGMSEDKGP